MTPPKEIPQNLFDRFTMRRKVSVEYSYQNSSATESCPKVYKREAIDTYCKQIEQRKTFYYGLTDTYLYKALERYSVAGKTVAIIGSQSPLYESICLFYGGSPTVIDYQKIIYEDDRIKAMTVEEYNKKPIAFDAAFSISSFEHDGLGRYGDPINPDADLDAMTKMKSMIKPRGMLFLSIPVERNDRLIWNLYRTYGRLRLPKLLLNWKIVNIYGWGTWQPVFVLQNSSGKGYLNCALGIFLMSYAVRPFAGKIKRLLKSYLG
jgi:hypothetical protein